MTMTFQDPIGTFIKQYLHLRLKEHEGSGTRNIVRTGEAGCLL